MGGDHRDPALGGAQHQLARGAAVGERGQGGEDRRVVGHDGVAAGLARLAQHLVAQLEGDQHPARGLVVAADQQADVVPLLGQRRGREALDGGEELRDQHRAHRSAGRRDRGAGAGAASAREGRVRRRCPEEHEAHQLDAPRPAGRAGLAHRRDGDARDLVDVPAVDPGPDGRHRHGGGAQAGGDLERAREAGGEQRRVGLAGAPVRPDRVHDPPRRQARPPGWRRRRPRRARRGASCAAARGTPSSSAGPAAAWIAPSTPLPPSSDGLAAFTIALTACAVMSPSTASSRTQAAAAAAAFSARCAGTWA